MSYSERYMCDICGAEKGETNHWFEAIRDRSEGATLLLTPFMGRHEEVTHLCSSACLIQHVHKFEESLREQQKGS